MPHFSSFRKTYCNTLTTSISTNNDKYNMYLAYLWTREVLAVNVNIFKCIRQSLVCQPRDSSSTKIDGLHRYLWRHVRKSMRPPDYHWRMILQWTQANKSAKNCYSSLDNHLHGNRVAVGQNLRNVWQQGNGRNARLCWEDHHKVFCQKDMTGVETPVTPIGPLYASWR